MLKIGEKFPSFSLQNQNGESKSLHDYSGKWLVLYVYPKDDTPGCTIQGKSFTATKEDFEKLGVQVVGLSHDDVNSHKNFCNKYSLTVELLADPQGNLLSSAQVGQSEYKGNMYWNRTTFLINPSGHLKKIYENVTPEGHEKLLLTDLKELMH